MKLAIKGDFYSTLTEQNRVLEYYKDLVLNTNSTAFYNSKNGPINLIKKSISIKLFPSYLTPTFLIPEIFSIKILPQKNITGYAIILKGTENINQFLINEYSKSFRSNIKRLYSRFENCFNVTYHMFYGQISLEDYNDYMNILHAMLINRFDQRNDKNDILENWNYYLETTFDFINDKKASIFVIYSNKKPVHICINHHLNKILFVSIPSYDIDYAKFALGNISIYKLLEWSLMNNHDMLDLAYGDLEYKRRWSNLLYKFEHHIIYNSNEIVSHASALLEINIIKLKNYLKKYHVDTYVKKIKSFKIKNKNINSVPAHKIIENPLMEGLNLSEIDYNLDEYSFIRKFVFDFLYVNKEHIDNIHVFKNKLKDNFFITGKSNNQMICFLTHT